MRLTATRLLLISFLLVAWNVLPSSAVCHCLPAISPDSNSLTKAVAALQSDKDLKSASISVIAIDILSGKSLVELNADVSLTPASVMKLFTTSTALELLGRNFRFSTRLEYDGKIKDSGVLEGNLYVTGGGDPTLGSMRFADYYYKKNFLSVWTDTIKRTGIRSISGAILGDASIYKDENTPSTWIWGDIANHYGASPSGLSIYDNVYKLHFKSGPNQGDSTSIVKVEPEIRDITFINKVKASNESKDNAYIYGGLYENERRIWGSIPKGKNDFEIKGSIPDPPYQTAIEVEKALKAVGITSLRKTSTLRRLHLAPNDSVPRTLIYESKSPILSQIVGLTNLYSINLYAEMILKYVGKQSTGIISTYDGCVAVEKFIASKGIDTGGFFMNDGSGLSRYNAITTRQISGLLRYMYKSSKDSSIFYNSLPIAGKSGSLSSLCKGTPAEKNLRAKSGYMTRVRSYAGYVKTKSGKMLAFAMIANNYTCSASVIKKKLEELMIIMAELD